MFRGELEEAKRYLTELEINRLGKTKQHHVYRGRMIIANAEGRWADAEREARNWKSNLNDYYSGDWVDDRITDIVDYIAISLTERGRLQEAELVLRERLLEELDRFGSSQATNVAELYGDLSKVYLRAGRIEDAMALARQSCVIAKRLKMGWGSIHGGLLECVWFQANAQFALRRFKAARAMYDKIKSEYGRINPLGFESFVRDDPNRLLILILTGPEADTATVVDGLIARLTEKLGPKHYQSAEAKALKAALLARSGKPQAALPLFREAFAVMTRRSHRAPARATLAWCASASPIFPKSTLMRLRTFSPGSRRRRWLKKLFESPPKLVRGGWAPPCRRAHRAAASPTPNSPNSPAASRTRNARSERSTSCSRTPPFAAAPAPRANNSGRESIVLGQPAPRFSRNSNNAFRRMRTSSTRSRRAAPRFNARSAAARRW